MEEKEGGVEIRKGGGRKEGGIYIFLEHQNSFIILIKFIFIFGCTKEIWETSHYRIISCSRNRYRIRSPIRIVELYLRCKRKRLLAHKHYFNPQPNRKKTSIYYFSLHSTLLPFPSFAPLLPPSPPFLHSLLPPFSSFFSIPHSLLYYAEKTLIHYV